MFRKKSDFGIRPSSFDLSKVEPLVHAFAHNDSVYNTPLFDALQLGYSFIEADVHLINNEILVYHKKPFFTNNNKTFTNCYLQPLLEIIKKTGSVFPKNKKPVHLILDIKTDAEATYDQLKLILQPYQSILTFWENEMEHSNAIKIILSGNRTVETVLSETKRWVAIDGRLEDIEKNYPSYFMPMISDKYSKIFGYSFFFKKPNPDKLKQVQNFSKKIHQQNKLFRLWGIPEQESVWKVLLENDLDLISTDRIEKLRFYLAQHLEL